MVHDYQQVDIKIMRDMIEHCLDDLILFTNLMMQYLQRKDSATEPETYCLSKPDVGKDIR